jgi:hypothetical protein
MSLICVDWELFMASKEGELGVIVCVGEEEYGEKEDRGSAEAGGVSSDSESAGVIVGGGGWTV